AVIDGREEAFTHYWRERDISTLPLHFDALQQGAVGFNNPLMRWVISHVNGRPDLRDRAALVFERKLPPDQLVPMPTMLKWMGEALLRGRFDVLKGFLAMGKQTSAEQREIANRRALWEASRDALARAPKANRQRAGEPYRDAAARAALIV